MISLGTCPSSLAAVANGLVDVFTTFRVSDNGSKGVWSLVGTKTFRTLDLDLHMFTVLEGEFFKRIRDQYK
jgi:hypothetical protein